MEESSKLDAIYQESATSPHEQTEKGLLLTAAAVPRLMSDYSLEKQSEIELKRAICKSCIDLLPVSRQLICLSKVQAALRLKEPEHETIKSQSEPIAEEKQ